MPGTLLSSACAALAVVGLAVHGASGTARADLAYSYARLDINDFTVFGASFIDLGGGNPAPAQGFLRNEATDYPNFGDAVTEQATTAASGTADWSTSQATNGPGPFPAEDTFGTALSGEGARSDSAIFAILPIGGFNGSLVAEARRTTIGGYEALSRVDGNFYMTQISPDPIMLSFSAETHMLAQKTPDYNSAAAWATFRVVVRDYDSNALLLTWTPGSDPLLSPGLITGGILEPYDLNERIEAGAGTVAAASFVGAGIFALSFEGQMFQRYKVEVRAQALAQVGIREPPVPEPATWLLLASGLAGLVLMARRRRFPQRGMRA